MHRERVKDETKVHISLWKTCNMLEYVLEESLEHVQEEYLYANILILQYFTFEAFLNFLGQNIKPKVWENERSYFYKNEFNGKKSTLGKFWFLAIECECEDYFKSEGNEYYQFIEEDLKEIRDFFAHAKPDISEKERLRDPNSLPEYLDNFADQNISLKTVQKGFEYVDHLINHLHKHANKIYKYDRYVENPLMGPDRILSGGTIE